MEQGWIKLHRKLLDNDIYRHDPTAWRVFCHFLLIVDHKTGCRDYGRFQVARELDMNPNTLYKAIKRLENAKMVTQESNNRFTVLSIVNWHDYQSNDNKAGNNKVTTKEQQSNTKQELRIKKKETKHIYIEGEVSLEDVKEIADKYNLYESDINKRLEDMRLWSLSGGNKKVDWKLTLMTWLRKDMAGGLRKRPVVTQEPVREEVASDPAKVERIKQMTRDMLKGKSL
jgi:DNA-binding transcriptional regulator YhcF (GntR family)